MPALTPADGSLLRAAPTATRRTPLEGHVVLTAMVTAVALGCSSAAPTPSTVAGGAMGAGGSQQVGEANGTGGNPSGVSGAMIGSSYTGGRPNVGGADTATSTANGWHG